MNWLRIILFSVLDSEPEDSNDYIIAKYLLDHYTKLSGVSLTEISKQCNVSKAAISRFCKKLGLIDYIDLQTLIRMSKNNKVIHDSKLSIEQQKEKFSTYLNHSMTNIISIMNNPIVENLIEDIVNYKSILLFGHLQSSHIAYTLRNNLAILSKFCFCSQSIIEQKNKISNATSDDLIIIFSSNGEFFKRIDMNQNYLNHYLKSKMYIITCSEDKIIENEFIKVIHLDEKYEELTSNMSMNIFVNYISYRFKTSVSIDET